MQNKFIEMLKLQNTFNTNTNGAKWIEGITREGRIINWYRCIYMEACEAIDSLNWKHWKDINKEEDIENVKIELVDIWHFLMSQLITDKGLDDATHSCLYFYKAVEAVEYSKEPTLINCLDTIITQSSNKELPIEMFFLAVKEIENFSMDDVYVLYIGKNCLNQFRQDNGYKDGSYKKIWNGKEDNVYMQNILHDSPETTYKELYILLENIYKDLD